MTRGRKRTRSGNERSTSFEVTPEIDIAFLDLQKHYMQTQRGRPSKRELLIEGLSLLLEREKLPALPEPLALEMKPVIEMPKKMGV
jgi:hypothetical protein